MYDKYFHSKVVDKALGTDEYTEESLDSYMFRIINLTNKNSNLDALKGLRKIYQTIDFKNISRLKSTEDAFEIACEIYGIIMKNLPEPKLDKDGNPVPPEFQDGNDEGGTELSDEQFEKLLDSLENGTPMEDEESDSENSVGIDGVDGGGEPTNETPSDKIELSPAQKKQLQNAINKQNKFMDGEVTKKNVTKKEKQELQTIESSGMGYVEVGEGLDNYSGKNNTKCIVVRNFNKSLIEHGNISIISKWKGDRYDEHVETNYESDVIGNGIRLGTVLGRKLQVRGESRETKWTRLDSGKIDKRLISELGFGNDRVFSNSFIEEYSDAFLHISVDASGSMGGTKWDNTMTSVVAICKAIDMVNNVDVVVSFRSTQSNGNSRSYRNDTTKPLILIAYDSRKDSFQKVKNLFKYITYSGTTPEGLCYQAIMNDIVPTTNDRDSYFLNFSDGMPMFSNNELDYHGDQALNHTKKMVKEIRNRGIKVLSYYIGDSYDYGQRNMGDFKQMYGGDSEFIDVTSVMSVSKTMNKKFLQK